MNLKLIIRQSSVDMSEYRALGIQNVHGWRLQLSVQYSPTDPSNETTASAAHPTSQEGEPSGFSIKAENIETPEPQSPNQPMSDGSGSSCKQDEPMPDRTARNSLVDNAKCSMEECDAKGPSDGTDSRGPNGEVDIPIGLIIQPTSVMVNQEAFTWRPNVVDGFQKVLSIEGACTDPTQPFIVEYSLIDDRTVDLTPKQISLLGLPTNENITPAGRIAIPYHSFCEAYVKYLADHEPAPNQRPLDFVVNRPPRELRRVTLKANQPMVTVPIFPHLLSPSTFHCLNLYLQSR